MPPRFAPADVLIVGAGLAGSTLAWAMLDRGMRVRVVDRGGVDTAGRPSASRVAAGLITPVTGRRLTLDPRWDELWRAARDRYRRVEQATGATVLEERSALRLFAGEDERARFVERSSDAAFRRHARLASTEEIPSCLHAPHGGFVMPHAARLDTAAYLDATRRHLEALGVYRQGEASADEGVEAGYVVRCVGYCANEPLRLEPAKGEVLTVASNAEGLDRVVHRGVWVAPVGGCRYRVGSTYAWDVIDSVPTEPACRELLASLADFLPGPCEVVDHLAAVRPATPDRRPIARLAEPPARVGWFNGLGAKGALWAPWHAERLAEAIATRTGSADAL